jgi:hypothetical protein
VLIFFIAGLLYLLRLERVDNLGAYRIPPETGILIPSDYINYRVATPKSVDARGRPICPSAAEGVELRLQPEHSTGQKRIDVWRELRVAECVTHY